VYADNAAPFVVKHGTDEFEDLRIVIHHQDVMRTQAVSQPPV